MFAIANELRRICVIAAYTVSLASLASPAAAQGQPATQSQDPAPATQSQEPAPITQGPARTPHEQTPINDEQLEQILAPVALYPDNLLAQVLTASTYPLEVVRAARWTKENPNIKGDALEEAMQNQPWDPSVKGLTRVPQVLAMMSDQLDWMEQLGEAFLAQPDDVSKAVQRLRAKAEATGNLKTSQQIRVKKVKPPPPPPPPPGGPAPVLVVDEPEYIEIEPAEPDVVYVPVYDPVVVYGAWPYPAYRPFFWRPPGFAYVGVIGFGAAIVVGPALWTYYDWRRRRVWIDVQRYNRFNRARLVGPPVRWQHNPVHRGGAPYRNLKLQQQFNRGRVVPVTPKGTVIPRPGTPKPAVRVVPGAPKTPVQPKPTVKRVGPPPTGKPITGPKPPAKPVTRTAPAKPVTTPRPVRPVTSPKPAHPTTTAKPARPVVAPKPARPVAAPKPVQRPAVRPAPPAGRPKPPPPAANVKKKQT